MQLSFTVLLYGYITLTILDKLLQNWTTNGVKVTEESHFQYSRLNEENKCKRTCKLGLPPMTCMYYFEIEWYHTLSKACYNCPQNTSDCFRPDCVPADGTKRGIVAINRKIPGPSIEVCQNDIIVVDVMNKMPSEATTIHWHGQPQRDTPYMDGVPYVTQCPILPFTTFRYAFKAYQAGTHFWHSHVGMQRVDGAFGALIVRVPKQNDYHNGIYDYDLPSHVMVINDWETELGTEMLMGHLHGGVHTAPPILLVNGLGRYREFPDNVYMPTARFTVKRGYRYRFRVINAGSLNCPIEISIDKHFLEVISTDGNDIDPVTATSIITYAGERFDFVLNANQTGDLYWIKFKGLINCNEKYKKAFQVAVLEYSGTNSSLDSYPFGEVTYFNATNPGIQINPLNQGMENTNYVIPVPKMKSVKKWDESLKPKPDFQYYVGFDFHNISNKDFNRKPYYGLFQVPNRRYRILTPQFNHISMLTTPFALLSQRDELSDDMFCNKDTVQEDNCEKIHCECLHGIKIPLDAVVEFVFVDEGLSYEVNHPLHIHGYDFRVIAMERVDSHITIDEIKRRDALGLIHRNLLNAPVKDTVTVPDGGYTIIRFIANSPGYWVMHCHIEVHMALGMAMILQVGEKQDMVPVPINFPKCGNYEPDVDDTFLKIESNAAETVEFTCALYILTFCIYIKICY